MIVSLKNISFAYDAAKILDNVSFSVNKGEYVAFIGPNGGGKSTAIKLILGFLKPQRGAIYVSTGLETMGYVPQQNLIDKAFPISVLDVVKQGALAQLKWWGGFSKEIHSKAFELLKMLRCQTLAKRSFGTLSGGQAQKVLIARSLMCDPEILLLDEPTANIDVDSEQSIYSFLNSLKRKKTIIIVSHDFDAIMKNVDRVICFQNSVKSMKPSDVCKHFSMGMYHE